MLFLWLAVCVVVCVVGAAAESLPKTIEICKRSDQECLFRSVPKALRAMKNGIPQLGVLPVDPMHITQINIDKGAGPIQVKLNFKNQLVEGISEAAMVKTKGDFTDDNYRLELECKLPRLTTTGEYSVNGRVLILPIQGVGKNNISLESPTVTLVLTGHVYEKNGEKYVEMDKIVSKVVKQKRVHINLTNLFNGNKALGDNMNKFLNDNWEVIWGELHTALENSISEIFNQIVNRIYSKVPYRIIHPQ